VTILSLKPGHIQGVRYDLDTGAKAPAVDNAIKELCAPAKESVRVGPSAEALGCEGGWRRRTNTTLPDSGWFEKLLGRCSLFTAGRFRAKQIVSWSPTIS
jgi:hypothetical protein